jgi:hypothetical protein
VRLWPADFAALSNQVGQALNAVELTNDPVRRLAIVETARRTLDVWPQDHYNFRRAEVQQLLSLLDVPTRKEVLALLAYAEDQAPDDKGKLDHVDLKPLDVISFPPGVSRRFMNVTPSGKVLPCHAAETLPGIRFPNVAEADLTAIWRHSEAFERFLKRGKPGFVDRYRMEAAEAIAQADAVLSTACGAGVATWIAMRFRETLPVERRRRLSFAVEPLHQRRVFSRQERLQHLDRIVDDRLVALASSDYRHLHVVCHSLASSPSSLFLNASCLARSLGRPDDPPLARISGLKGFRPLVPS